MPAGTSLDIQLVEKLGVFFTPFLLKMNCKRLPISLTLIKYSPQKEFVLNEATPEDLVRSLCQMVGSKTLTPT
jgi:hypothetical protein